MRIYFSRKAISVILCIILFSSTGCASSKTQSNPSLSVTPDNTSVSQRGKFFSGLAPNVSTASSTSKTDLWFRLQQADTHYFVLVRHALAPGTGDPPNFQLEDCSTQRNLSDEGRAQAKRIGEAFKQRDILVQQVLSS